MHANSNCKENGNNVRWCVDKKLQGQFKFYVCFVESIDANNTSVKLRNIKVFPENLTVTTESDQRYPSTVIWLVIPITMFCWISIITSDVMVV